MGKEFFICIWLNYILQKDIEIQTPIVQIKKNGETHSEFTYTYSFNHIFTWDWTLNLLHIIQVLPLFITFTQSSIICKVTYIIQQPGYIYVTYMFAVFSVILEFKLLGKQSLVCSLTCRIFFKDSWDQHLWKKVEEAELIKGVVELQFKINSSLRINP